MENYHLFIVDSVSLKYHLEYGFVGTGSQNINFNIGLWKDIERLKIGDKIIFYVQNIKKFFGVFKVDSMPFFEVNNPPYLQNQNELNIINNNGDNIYLKYRAIIKPFKVYSEGIDEFELIDILPAETRNVLWSIIYRKLKASRGNSPIFPIEYEIFINKLSAANNQNFKNSGAFTFENGTIIESNLNVNYTGSLVRNINNLQSIILDNFTEHHIHSLLIEKLPPQIFGNTIKWIGNEIYSGAGMQAIDLMSINENQNTNEYRIIEVKKGIIPLGVSNQIKKYTLWLTSRFFIQNPHITIQPIILGKISTDRQKNNRKNEIIGFNNLNLSKPIIYLEYNILDDQIIFNQIDLTLETFPTINSFTINQ